MASLYDIEKSISDVIENGFHVDEETGEYFDEESLDALNVDYEVKLENIALYCKNLDAEAAAIRNEEKLLAERRQAKERKSERLKGYMTTSMVAMGRGGLDTSRCRLSFRKSKSVNVYQESSIPERFLKVTTVSKPDKAAIKAAINSGEVVPGANIIESVNLQLK